MDSPIKSLGNRIKTYRKRLKLTQKDLAIQMGFNSPETVSQIERGDRELKAWELAQLSQHLSVDINDLLRQEKLPKQPEVLWRVTPDTDKDAKEALFIKRCTEYGMLEELNRSEGNKRISQKKVDPENIDFNTANILAIEIRQEFNFGERPAGELEKTLQNIFGVKIWYFEMDEGSAASTIGPFGPAILMNSKEAPWRRNFSLAHELFHLITWKSLPPSIISKSIGLWEKLEKVANAFASSLLLPSDSVSIELNKKMIDDKIACIDLVEIARSFGVSTEALLYRLLNMKRVEKETVDYMLEDQDFRDIDRETMSPLWWQPPKFPERFVRLAFVAYKKDKISKSKLASLLDTSLFDLSDILREYGLIDREGYNVEVRVT